VAPSRSTVTGMSQQPTSDVGAGPLEYVVVLRAPSSARFLPEEGLELNIAAPALDVQRARLRAFTRWVEENGQQLPRELIVEVRGDAPSLEEAVAKFAALARPVATVAGFVGNVRVGALEVHLAYDCTASKEERSFLETFLPDERGSVLEGRILRLHLMQAASMAVITLTTDSARVTRALRHYELALREWYVGGEWLALNHLWIAAENLTKAVVRKALVARDISEEELAQEQGLVTDDPERPRWRQLLGPLVRMNCIFDGDKDTYETAKDASDGIEHGYWELDKVAAHALKSADKTFGYIRRTIVDLLDLDTALGNELVGIKPKDVQSVRKVVRGRIIGASDELALEGELYPTLAWTSGIDRVSREGTTFKLEQRDRITVRMHSDLGFKLDRLEYHGRLEDGEAPVRMSDEDVVVDYTPASTSQRLFESVMPLVDAAAASGLEQGHTLPSMFAFNMFGQAIAFFQSIGVLITARRPVEALPGLRGLVLLAARFEQMTDPAGPGLGIAVRNVLEALDSFNADPELTARRKSEIVAAVDPAVTTPDRLPAPETSSIYTSLGAEMQFATGAVNATYATNILHMQRINEEHAGFHVQVEPGPLTDMISTAAVIAMLELLKQVSTLLDWTLDDARADELLGEARVLNEAAANLDLTPSGQAGPVTFPRA
jgi:hypothetical protein